MGLLSVLGHPLSWPQSLPHLSHIKQHAILQFLALYRTFQTRASDAFLWGDETEGFFVSFPADENTVELALIGSTVLEALERYAVKIKKNEYRGEGTKKEKERTITFLPEYGRHMVEATPGQPYGSATSDLVKVEINMAKRRELIDSMLMDNESYLTCTVFPLMGVGQFTTRPYPVFGPVSQSQYVMDEIINEHPRFPALTANIRKRRGRKVEIKIPMWLDENTKGMAKPAEHGDMKYPELEKKEDALNLQTNFIYGDCMAFGMGSCCLQVTFQARSIHEARKLYDKLAVLSPLFLALTAGSPIFHGMLANHDVRWSAISQAVDDRTEEELKFLPKSRYSSIDCYLSEDSTCLEEYHDIPIPIDEPSYKTLIEHGVDHKLARHVAHLFTRDPLVIFEEKINVDDEKFSDHFENVQSTNWNNVRFKPPPPHGNIGWRVEFRTMEIQLTDFENAAFAVFVALVSRAILFFGINLYLPMSLNDVNMDRAHHVDAVLKEKFFFRKTWRNCTVADQIPEEIHELTVEEIFCGKTHIFPGLIPLVQSYLDLIKCDLETRAVVENYISLISGRARGKLQTCAAWTRDFVREHADYKKDSVVSPSIARDLLSAYDDIAHNLSVPYADAMFGELNINNPASAHLAYLSNLKKEKVEEMKSKSSGGPRILRSSTLVPNKHTSCEHLKRIWEYHMKQDQSKYLFSHLGVDEEESTLRASLEFLDLEIGLTSPANDADGMAVSMAMDAHFN